MENNPLNEPSSSRMADRIPGACNDSTHISEFTSITSQAVILDRTCAIDIAREHSLSEWKDLCSCNKNNGYITPQEINDKVDGVFINMLTTNTFFNTNQDSSLFSPEEKNTLHIKKPWEDYSMFKKEWISNIQKYQSSYIPFKLLTNENKIWMEYLVNKVDSRHSTIICRFSH